MALTGISVEALDYGRWKEPLEFLVDICVLAMLLFCARTFVYGYKAACSLESISSLSILVIRELFSLLLRMKLLCLRMMGLRDGYVCISKMVGTTVRAC